MPKKKKNSKITQFPLSKIKLSPTDPNFELKMQILSEANLIIKSVNFAEKELNIKIKELDEARASFLLKEEAEISVQIKVLIKRLDQEILEMDRFLAKYKKQIEDAKKGKF